MNDRLIETSAPIANRIMSRAIGDLNHESGLFHRTALRSELTKRPPITHKEIRGVSEIPIWRISVNYLIPT